MAMLVNAGTGTPLKDFGSDSCRRGPTLGGTGVELGCSASRKCSCDLDEGLE